MKGQKIKFIKIFLLLIFFSCYTLYAIRYTLLFAQEDNKLVALTKQIMEAKDNKNINAYLEELKDLYFANNNYTGLVEFLESLSQKKNTLEPLVNYYIASSRYHQLKYLEEKQKWDEYFNNGNAYRDQLAQSLQKTIDTTNATEALNLYSRLLLWQFHKDQQDAFVEVTLSELINAVSEYSPGAQEVKPIKDIADKLSAYAEKAKAKQIYKIYVSKIAASALNDNELQDIAAGFYKEGNLELSEIVYDVYIERVVKSYPPDKCIPILADIAKKFSYHENALPDGFYAEKIFHKIEEIGRRDAFGEELTYLRAFNLEKIKEYAKAKDFYLDLVKRFPQTTYSDEADFKAGIISTYVLRDIKAGRLYFEKLSQKETLSPQVISSLYQLGLLSQWENDLAKAKDYYRTLMEKIKGNFTETAALAKERLKEIDELKPIEYNLKTFLDVSLKEENAAFDATRLNLSSSRHRIKKTEDSHISSAPYNIESGCMPVEIQYLWSGHLGTARPSLEQSAFDTTYIQAGTKEINLVIVSPSGIVDRNIEMLDVY